MAQKPTFFTRREVFTTVEAQKFYKVRELLEQNQIPYTVKTTNRLAPNALAPSDRARTGSLGLKNEYLLQYQIFVHRNSHDMALHLIRQNLQF